MANITSASITLRSTKGSPLTNTEVDNNFSNINTALATGLTAASYTAADVLSKVNSLTGYSQAGGLNSDTMTFNSGARSATNANTANTIVARDASGNFSAGTITAALTGTASIASSLNYTVAIAGGGTGATDASTARSNLGLVINTNVQGWTQSLSNLGATTSAADTIPYFNGTTSATTTAFTAFGRSLAGTASYSTAAALLQLRIGTEVQAADATLTSLSGLSSYGIVVKTAAGTIAGRTIVAGGGITITNGTGVAGNITVDASVTSVQGQTGAVIVSVPVSSVQGQIGAVIVTNIGGHAGASPHATNATNAHNASHAATAPHAHNSNNSTHANTAPHAHNSSYGHQAHNAQTGWPGHLSQFANNLGNYGNFSPNCRCNC
jgi:hypothetical protein